MQEGRAKKMQKKMAALSREQTLMFGLRSDFSHFATAWTKELSVDQTQDETDFKSIFSVIKVHNGINRSAALTLLSLFEVVSEF